MILKKKAGERIKLNFAVKDNSIMKADSVDKKYKLLIVDDIPKNIQILGNILKREEYKISYALNGKDAIAMTKMHDFDLILLDIMMPGIDGYEVCTELKKNQKTSEIPIIFLTAKAEKESVVKGFQVGAADYLTKPFNAEELLARVETHLVIRKQQQQLKSLNQLLEQKVTERTRQLQEANKQLSTLEKAKSDFLNIISHELRTPLNGLQGLIELLEDTQKTKNQEEYIEYLREAADRLVKFSEIALLITSLNAEKYKLQYSPQRIKYMIEDIKEQLIEAANEKDVDIVVSINPSDMQINLDFDLVKTSLGSLMDNALRFSPASSVVEIRAYHEKKKPVIEFCDRGPGFSEEMLSKPFNYFNTDDVMNSEGLGLSVAAIKLIMDAHRGKLEAKNRPDGGACVKLIF